MWLLWSVFVIGMFFGIFIGAALMAWLSINNHSGGSTLRDCSAVWECTQQSPPPITPPRKQ